MSDRPPVDVDGPTTDVSPPPKGSPERAELKRQSPVYAVLGALLVAFGGMAGAFVAAQLLGLVLYVSGAGLSPTTTFALTFLATAAGLAGTAALYITYRGFDPVEYVGIEVPSFRDLTWVVGGYLGAMALVTASAIVLTQFNVDPNTTNRAAQAGIENPSLLLWLIPLSFLVIAPAEEFLFRGTVQRRLREAFSPWIAIPATATLFALLHFFSLTGGAGGRFIAIGVLFFPSLVFGTVYEYTDNLVSSMLVHGAYNSTLVLLVFVSLQYGGQGVGILG